MPLLLLLLIWQNNLLTYSYLVALTSLLYRCDFYSSHQAYAQRSTKVFASGRMVLQVAGSSIGCYLL